MDDWGTDFLTTAIALLAIIDPLGCTGTLLSITEGDTPSRRQNQVLRGHLYALILLLVFYFLGAHIMRTFNLTLDAVRVGGGLILVKIGFNLLSARAEPRSTKEEQADDRTRSDCAFFPLAMPLLAGPGALTLVLTQGDLGPMSWGRSSADLGAIVAAISASLAVLLSTGWFVRVLGVSGMSAVSRIMGFLLVCISVQMILLGIKGVMG